MYKTRGVAMFLKIVLTPRQAYPEVKLQGRDLMRVVGIVAPFAPMGVRYPGKIRFIEPQEGGGNGHRRRVPGASSSGTPRESQANFRVVTVWGL